MPVFSGQWAAMVAQKSQPTHSLSMCLRTCTLEIHSCHGCHTQGVSTAATATCNGCGLCGSACHPWHGALTWHPWLATRQLTHACPKGRRMIRVLRLPGPGPGCSTYCTCSSTCRLRFCWQRSTSMKPLRSLLIQHECSGLWPIMTPRHADSCRARGMNGWCQHTCALPAARRVQQGRFM